MAMHAALAGIILYKHANIERCLSWSRCARWRYPPWPFLIILCLLHQSIGYHLCKQNEQTAAKLFASVSEGITAYLHHQQVVWNPTQGYKQPLQPDDIFEVSNNDRVEVVSADFRRQWGAQMAKPGGPSLVRASHLQYCAQHLGNTLKDQHQSVPGACVPCMIVWPCVSCLGITLKDQQRFLPGTRTHALA